MNKSQFLAHLNQHLQVIPEKERYELIEDYEAHFEFGLQQGKTEGELAKELGSPDEIAIEVIAEYERSHAHKNSNINTASTQSSKSKTPRTIFTIIGLFLLNFVCAVAPLFLSIWATWVSLFLAFALLTISPLFAFVEFYVNDYFSAGKLFASFIFSGAGILLVLGTLYVGKYLKHVTVSYVNWNVKTVKGVD